MRSLEVGLEHEVWGSATDEFKAYLGWVFERVAWEFVVQATKLGELPARLEAVGSWWSEGEEIDVAAALRKEGFVMLFEVKWSDLSLREARSALARLAEKATKLSAEERVYGLIARRVEAKDELRREGYAVSLVSMFAEARASDLLPLINH
jgi:AAA+ ATPase superfamily predicted ATPase